jgi:hypothetical protein
LLLHDDLWTIGEGDDGVVGLRATRADGPLRMTITRVVQLVDGGLGRLWIRDANCASS